LGVVASLDKPGSPAGEAKTAFNGELFGRTSAVKNQFRDRVLAVSIDDMLRVAATYLKPGNRHTAVLTGAEGQSAADSLGLKTEIL